MDYFNPIDGRRVLLDKVTNAAVRLTASNETINSSYFTRHGKSDRGEKAEYDNTID
jgi:hypothetical protein